MEKGLKNLIQAFRIAQKKLENQTYHDVEDSATGISPAIEDNQEDDDVLLSTLSNPPYPHSRQQVPSIQSFLQPMQYTQHPQPHVLSIPCSSQGNIRNIPSIESHQSSPCCSICNIHSNRLPKSLRNSLHYTQRMIYLGSRIAVWLCLATLLWTPPPEQSKKATKGSL